MEASNLHETVISGTLDIGGLPLSISTGNTATSTQLKAWSYNDLVDSLKKPKITDKKGDVKYFVRSKGTTRSNEGTADTGSVIIIDGDKSFNGHDIFDYAPSVEIIVTALKTLKIHFLIYTSYSNKPDKPKYRIVIPCMYTREQLKPTLEHLFKHLHKKNVHLVNAKENSTWAQAWYLPSISNIGNYECDVIGGEGFKILPAVDLKPSKKGRQENRKTQDPKIKIRDSSTSLDGQIDSIAEFNKTYSIHDVLLRNDYTLKGERYLHPNSSSGVAGVQVCGNCSDGVLRIYSHSDDELNDGYAKDAFDCFRILECAGDWPKALAWNSNITKHNREVYQKAQRKQNQSRSGSSKQAQRLANGIGQRLSDLLNINEDNEAEFLLALDIRVDAIEMMLISTFWNPQQAKFYAFTHDDSLNAYVEKDTFKFLKRTHGAIFNSEMVRKKALIKKAAERSSIQERFANLVCRTPGEIVLDELKYSNQRSNIEMRVDMFAEHPRMELQDERVRMVFPHKQFIVNNSPNTEAVEDYKKHFPEFDRIIDFIVASRFACDRKKAYIWFHCPSDWGKGFLIGLLNELGTAVDVSVKEVEMMFEGKPVGKSMVDFKRAFVLVIDEFKTVKSELKQLQSEISLAPKNQLAFKVEIFAKFLFSAENVNSLVGEHGVEDQFANRISLIKGDGDITSRAVYKRLTGGVYFKAILHYLANELNRRVKSAVQMGPSISEQKSELFLNDFIEEYGLGNEYQRLSTGIQEVAGRIVEDLMSAKWLDNRAWLPHEVIKSKEYYYVKCPAKLVENWLKTYIADSERWTLLKKKNEIINCMSIDGRGNVSHKIEGKQIRAVCFHHVNQAV